MNENFDVTYKALFRKYYPSLIFYATRLVGGRGGGRRGTGCLCGAMETEDSIEIATRYRLFSTVPSIPAPSTC